MKPSVARQLAEQIQAEAPIAVQVVASGRSSLEDLEIETRQVDALLGAAREALRNVRRHAGVDRAEVRIRCHRGQIRIDIADEGRGIPDGATGFGTRWSIQERMDQAGGRAHIGNHAHGAQVRLEWPATQPNSKNLSTTYARTVAACSPRVFLIVALPMLVAHSYLAWRYLLSCPHIALSLVVYLGVTLSALVVAFRLRRTAPSVRFVVTVGVGQILLLTVGLYAGGPGAIGDFRSWAIGFVTVPLCTCAFVCSARWLWLLLGGPLSVVLVYALADPVLPFTAALGSVNAAITTILMAWILGDRLRRTEGVLQRERQRSMRATEQLEQRRHLAAIREDYLSVTAQTVAPWLGEIARGELDPSSPAVIATAREFSTQVRDDLYAGAFLDDRRRALIHQRRRAGGRVDLRPGLSPADRDGALTAVLDLILDPGRHHHVTVQANADSEQIRVSVLPPLDEAALATARTIPAATVATDAFVTVITCARALEASQLLQPAIAARLTDEPDRVGYLPA